MPTNTIRRPTAVLSTLKSGLREAEVLELRAGGRLAQRSSLVVLKGTLRAAGHAADLPTAKGAGSSPRHLFFPAFLRHALRPTPPLLLQPAGQTPIACSGRLSC